MEKLETMEWSDIFSIGNEKIDKDHHYIIDIYNELNFISTTEYNPEKFAEVLSKMTDYSIYHFKREEEYMQRFSYPQIKEHHNYHLKYVLKVSQYNSDFLTDNPPVPEEIVRFLEKWWKFHIQNTDSQYEKFKFDHGFIVEY